MEKMGKWEPIEWKVTEWKAAEKLRSPSRRHLANFACNDFVGILHTLHKGLKLL